MRAQPKQRRGGVRHKVGCRDKLQRHRCQEGQGRAHGGPPGTRRCQQGGAHKPQLQQAHLNLSHGRLCPTTWPLLQLLLPPKGPHLSRQPCRPCPGLVQLLGCAPDHVWKSLADSGGLLLPAPSQESKQSWGWGGMKGSLVLVLRRQLGKAKGGRGCETHTLGRELRRRADLRAVVSLQRRKGPALGSAGK